MEKKEWIEIKKQNLRGLENMYRVEKGKYQILMVVVVVKRVAVVVDWVVGEPVIPSLPIPSLVVSSSVPEFVVTPVVTKAAWLAVDGAGVASVS